MNIHNSHKVLVAQIACGRIVQNFAEGDTAWVNILQSSKDGDNIFVVCEIWQKLCFLHKSL